MGLDGGSVTRSSASLRLVHSWLLLIASTAVMAGASMATHIAGSAEGGSEAAEHAQHIAAPTIIGPLGALSCSPSCGCAGSTPPARLVLALPVLAFAIQEVAERMTEAAAPEPGIVATAITQVLFGLLAFALARVVLRTARRIAQSSPASPAALVSQSIAAPGRSPWHRLPRPTAGRRTLRTRTARTRLIDPAGLIRPASDSIRKGFQ